MANFPSLAEFFINAPPMTVSNVEKVGHQQAHYYYFPPILIHCNSPECSGERIFRNHERHMATSEWRNYFVIYKCSNCDKSFKIFAIAIHTLNGGAEVQKYGEAPAFGPPIPTRAMSLVGPDRELFLKGRRAENQGLGIAAFAYYRRIIENQWQRLLNEISKVGAKTGLDPAVQQHIEEAKKERQFDKAVKSMGDAIPPTLKMNGQNPIALLYSALSEGIHAQSDEECLELAGHIRVILYELAERLNAALQEHNELDAAVKRLANRKNPAPKSET